MGERWKEWMTSGLFCAVMSSLVFSVMNALVKAVSVHIPSNEIVFFRSAIGTVLILLLMRVQGMRASNAGIPLLVLRGSLGALYMLAYFYTIAYMPLVDAIILVNLSPVFSFILAAIFLKEKLPGRMGLILPVIFAGAMLTINPLGYSTYSAVALFGIAAAVLSGAAGVCIRYLSRSFHAYEIILYFMAAATLISIPLMWRDFVVPTPWELFLLTAMGVVSLLAQVFFDEGVHPRERRDRGSRPLHRDLVQCVLGVRDLGGDPDVERRGRRGAHRFRLHSPLPHRSKKSSELRNHCEIQHCHLGASFPCSLRR